MCGRFAITNPRFKRIEAILGTTFPEVRPRYNISPTQGIPVIRESAEGAHELIEMRWGLVPHWSKEPKPPYSTFNARAETLTEKPAFRGHPPGGGLRHLAQSADKPGHRSLPDGALPGRPDARLARITGRRQCLN